MAHSTGEIPHTEEESAALGKLQKLADEKGIKPLDVDAVLARADFWPEDESADDFIRAVEEWRRDKRTREP